MSRFDVLYNMTNKEKFSMIQAALRRWFCIPTTVEEVKQFEKDNPEPLTKEEQDQLDRLNKEWHQRWREKHRW
jgi:hypothetical protein